MNNFQFSIFSFQSRSNVLISKLKHSTLGQAGFTLVEILVAIAIMGMVFGVIFSSVTAIGKRSRDQQRITDLQNIQASLAQYYADQTFFPDATFNLSSATVLDNNVGNPLTSTASKFYLTQVPKNPRSPAYCYRPVRSLSDSSACDNNSPTSACQFYHLCAQMENLSGTPSTACQTVCGASFTQAIEITPNKSSNR